MDVGELKGFLRRLKWKHEPHGNETLRSVHDTEQGPVNVYLRLTENWLIASVVPFLDSLDGDNSFELSRWLLRMNRDMRQTKFAYDEDGDVVLSVELPTESLDYSEVEAALRALLDDTIDHRSTLGRGTR